MENLNEIESKGLLASLVGVGMFSKIFNKKWDFIQISTIMSYKNTFSAI